MTPAEILDLPLEPGNDSGATTIRGYLIALLAEVWKYTEGFSGKRPFGNSDWVWDLYAALGRGGAVPITFDEYGDVDQVDTRECDRLIAAAIRELENPAAPDILDVLYTPIGEPGEGFAVWAPAVPDWRADVAAELDVASAAIWLHSRRLGVERHEIAVRVRRVDTYTGPKVGADG